MSYLIIDNLTKKFNEVTAVNNANICVEKGEFFTFLGPSGCGKTTTLRMVAGFEKPTEGKVAMDGKDITNVAPEKKEIGMMFQNYALFPHYTVFENIAYGLKIKRLPKNDIDRKVKEYMSLVGLSGYEKRKISQLSGGEQQRVALARSLVTEPKILLLDEPLSNLDAKMREEMRVELKRLQRELNITMLYVTHDQSEALMMSDRIAIFNKGVIQQIGTPEDIYNKPSNSFVANFVGQTNILEVKQESNKLFLSNGLEIHSNGFLSSSKKISIRNELIILSDNETNNENCFEGIIVAKQFNGIVSYFTVRVEGVDFNVTTINNVHFKYEVHNKVYIAIEKNNIVLLGN